MDDPREGGRAQTTALLPWIGLGLALAWNLAFVAHYGADIPRADEWRDVSVLLGDQPLTLDWLWHPHSVHRIPLPRLARFALYRLSGRDFRSALFFNVAVMALAAALMLRAASRCRGKPSPLDVFVPLLLLGPGHFMTFLWAFQVQFALSSALFFVAIAVVTSILRLPTPRGLALLGLSLALQVLTGANGVALAAPLLIWLFVALARTRHERQIAWGAAAVLSALATIVVAMYPSGLGASPPLPSWRLAVQTFFQFLSTGLGAAQPLWRLRAFLLAFLAASAVVLLVRAVRIAPAERWRASGLFACFASMLLLAAFVAVGRAELTIDAGMHPRYTTLAIGLVCLGYLCFLLYGGARSRRAVPVLLLAVTVLGTVGSVFPAVGYGDFRRTQLAALRQDAERGLPIEAIAARNGSAIYQYSPGTSAYLGRLLAHRAWPFERYELDSRVRARVVGRTKLGLESLTSRDLVSEGDGFRLTGPNPQIQLRVPRAVQVAGIELRFSLVAPRGRLLRLELHWDLAGGEDRAFPLGARTASFPVYTAGTPQALTAWVYDAVDTLRIDPDRSASRFKIHEVVLLELAPDWMPDASAGGGLVEDPRARGR